MMTVVVALPCSATDSFSLTKEETAWLAEHPVILFAIDPDNAPIEWINRKDQERGMSFEMLRLVEQRLGIHFERVESASWIESMTKRTMKTLIAAEQPASVGTFM